MEINERQLATIARSLKKASGAVKELAKAFDELATSLHVPAVSPLKVNETVSFEEATQAYEELRKRCEGVESETLGKLVTDFVSSHTKEYLTAFIRHNNLPLDTKDSKKELAKGLRQLLAQSAAISAVISHVGSSVSSSH